MARLLSNVLSWLHTTATSYDFESIESHPIEDSGITHKSTPRAANPLPKLKWSTPAVMQRIKQRPSPILQTTKQHSSPVLHSTKQSQSNLLRIVKEHPSWNTFIKPSTNHVASGVRTSKLETLPNEPKLAIMQRLPSLDVLHELTLASKSFHDFRSQNNPVVLPFVLRNELGPILFDEAYWVSQASQTNLFQNDYSQQVTSFLRKRVDYKPGSLLPSNVSSNTFVEMSTLYRKITFLFQDFYAWTTEDSTPMHCSQTLRLSLSQNEVLRIARAFYRLGIFCILFRHRRIGGLDSDAHEQYESTRRRAYRLFSFWNAWENEEIACVRDYIFARLAIVFARIQQAASIQPFKVIFYEPWDQIPNKFPSGTVYLDNEVRITAPEEDLAEVITTGSDSGYSSVTNSILPAQVTGSLQVPLDNLTKDDSESRLARTVVSTPLDEAICAAYKDVQEFNPALPAEAIALTESVGTLDAPTDSVSEEKPVMEAAVEPKCVVSAPQARKMARAISPRIKMLKLQQQAAHNDEVPITDLTKVEKPIIIQCTTPGSTVIPVSPPSPPASVCSTASDDSINFITDGVDGLPPGQVEEDLMVQYGTAEQSNPVEDKDEQPEELYMKDPSEVAAWIERSDSTHSSSKNSSKASTSPTKQQRKKANRKARQRTLEVMTKSEQEMQAERVRVEEAKKEHQKMKKERKKLDKEVCGAKKGKEKEKSQTTQPTKKAKKAKKERKIGYVIG